MALGHSPRMVMDGLVLCLDAGNSKGFDDDENLMTNSQLGNTVLNDGGMTLTTDTSIINPFGAYDGVLKCVHTTQTPGYFRRGQNMSLTAGVTYTFSFFFKNGTVVSPYGQNRLNIGLLASTYSPTFDETGQGLNQNTPVGDGWYRQVFTFTSAYTQTYQVDFNQTVNQTPIGTYYLYGFQLERGSSASPYYPTTGTAKNRGTTWTDLSRRGNNGTLTNGPTYSSANGGAIVFDGTNDVINSTTSIINRTNGQEITVSCWIKPSRLSGQYSVFCTNRSDNTSIYNWIFYQHTTDGAISFHGGAQYKSSYIPTPNVWINVANTVTASGVSTLYVNAVSKHTVTGYVYGNGTPGRLGIGADPGGQEPFQGNIAQVQVYNRALTAAEIKQNYDATVSRFIGSTPDRPAPSASYLVSLGITTNGYYYINLPTIGSTLIYCILDPAVDGGGWMVLWGAAQGATNYAYSFSASRDDISNSPINGFYSLSYAKRSAINSLCTENKTLVYAGSNSNWLRFDGYIWNSNSHTSGNFRFEFNSSLVTSNGTVDSSIEVGLTNYGVVSGGDFGIAINTNGLDHHSTGGYYNLNSGCNSMYLYQYASGYKVNTGLSGWYNATAGCTADNENDLPLLVAMK